MTAKRPELTKMITKNTNATELEKERSILKKTRSINVDALNDEQVQSLWQSLPADVQQKYLSQEDVKTKETNK